MTNPSDNSMMTGPKDAISSLFRDMTHGLRRGLTPVTVICLSLGVLGCIAVYNATFHLEHPFEYAGRQVVWLLVGAVALLFMAGRHRTACRRAAPWGGAILYLMLWLVLRYGISVNGMRGWFAWRGVFFKPSEVAKPFFVLLLAMLLEKTAHTRRDFRRGLLPCVILLVVWIVPVALQPDFGTVLVYICTFTLLCLCAGTPALHLAAVGAGMIPAAAAVVAATPYLRNRLAAFLDPASHATSAGWHITQFQQTLASGGLTGQSWGKGLWTQNYLPFGYSDSIFAAIGEAVGFLGLLPLVALLLAWIVYGYRRIQSAESYFEAAAITGMTSILAVQAFLHLSVNLGMFPPTGITLPLISYGGSSLLATVLAVGVVESMRPRPLAADRQ